MTAYATTERHRLHPKALILIVGGHAALLAGVMTAKMDLPVPFVRTPTEVDLIPLPKEPPPPPEPQTQTQPEPAQSRIDQPQVIIPIPAPDSPIADPLPMPLPEPGPVVGPRIDPVPQPQPGPVADPVRVGPRFATPPSLVRPPYPPGKLEREEEAALRLKLSIDQRGRVFAVEPVGDADRAFLAAARRHLIANWRYKPATEDGRPVPSTTVITLRFELTD